MEKKIQMVDLRGQYLKIKSEIDASIQQVIDSTAFINGPNVNTFAEHLSAYMGGCHVVPCANGTDALQIALMALGLQPGDEVIVPAFTYVASAEVIGLLGLTPVMADVDPHTFNLTVDNVRRSLTPHTKAIIPVHLFGQSCDMEPLLNLAHELGIYVVEDNAQSMGANYTFADGHCAKTGTMGDIGCTSFFPSKNLGCYGDGGAIFTRNHILAERIRMVANHGQQKKYHHKVIGCNSRLDTLQAAILDVKLRYLDSYNLARQKVAAYYTERLRDFDPNEYYLATPTEQPNSTHVYHQYTLRVANGRRDALKAHLASQGIPSMIYYPLPLHKQEALAPIAHVAQSLDTSIECANSVLSLPMHTELTHEEQDIIVDSIIDFYGTKQ